MSNNNFDKQIREKLAGHEVTPSPAVWENIEGHLTSTARSQYRWLAGLFFLVVVAGAAYYFTSSEPENSTSSFNTTSSSLLEAPQDKQAVALVPGDEVSIENSSKVTANNTQESDIERTKTAAETAGQVFAKEKSAQTVASVAQRERLSRSRSSAETSPKVAAQTAQEKLSGKRANTSQAQSEGSVAINSDKQAQSQDNIQTDPGSVPEDNTAEMSGVEKAWMNQQLEAAPTLISEEDTYSPVQTAAFLTLEERQRKALGAFDICDVLFPSIEDCPKFGDRRRRYQIDAYSQVGMLFSHLTNNDLDVEVNSYLNQRRSTEVPTWYLGFGLRLSTQWTNGLSLRGGLQVSESQIRVEYLDETQRQTTVNVSIDTLVDDEGNTTVVWDTISIIETGVENRQFHNTFTQIDIPLTVGYTFFGPRYDVEVNAGVMFNVLFQRSGRVFAPEDNTFYELGRTGAAPGTQPYRSELGLSLVTSAALSYRVSPQFAVFVEPQLRYFVDPVSPGSYALQENWFMGSIMLGGRYAF